jgi:hypothetical protein
MTKMERKIICLFLLIISVLVLSSCHPRRISDIRSNMTKEEVVSLWGKTPLMTTKTADGKTFDVWEYHFSSSNSACTITFSQDRVVNTECHPWRAGWYGYYSQPEQGRPEAPPPQRKLVREGFFAMRLAGALKVGEFKSEAEAESKLASVGVLPRNGWIADYPLTPKVITELEKSIAEAADSGKLSMNKDEALKIFQELIQDIGKGNVQAEPLTDEQNYSEQDVPPRAYYYPRYYPNPYYYPYPYPYFRFYPYPYFRYWR